MTFGGLFGRRKRKPISTMTTPADELIDIEEKDIYASIRKKRNWSSPGNDKITNYWLNPFPAEWVLRALIDFTLSNARRFYSSMGNPLYGKGLTTSKTVPINPFPAEWVLRALIDFTLSNARRFYSSMGNPLYGKGLRHYQLHTKDLLRL